MCEVRGMISNPTDYKMLTPPGGVLIDGGIMPARDVAGDGSWKVLRGEDPCFLLEAGRRIAVYAFQEPSLVFGLGEVTKTVDAQPMKSAIYGIREGVKSGRTWPNAPALKNGFGYYPDIVQPGTTGTADLWDGCLTPATVSATEAFVSAPSDFSTGNPLRADNVRKIFHDLNTVKAVVADGGTEVFSSGATERSREWRPDGSLIRDVTTDYSPGTLVFSAQGDSGFYGPTQTDYNWTATGVHNPMTHPEWLATLSPTSCWALWRVWTTFYPASGAAVKHEDGFVLDASITVTGDLAFSAPVSSAGLLQMAKAAHPGEVYDSALSMPGYSGEYVNAALVGVMFYDSGIDFSALGWTWPIQQGGN